MPGKQAGFTLLEMMVALGIVALIGVGSYRMLHSVLDVDGRLEQRAMELMRVQRTLEIMARDIEQMTARQNRDAGGNLHPALETGQGDTIMQFIHDGWSNPFHLPRGTMQRTSYRLKGGTLLRCYWDEINADSDSTPHTQPLLSNIRSLQVRYLDKNQQWQDDWSGQDEREVPQAVELIITVPPFGDIRSLMRL